MKKITAIFLTAVMLLSTACSSGVKTNKLPLGEDAVKAIISDSKLPVTAQKLDVVNDVEGLTVEYYTLFDNFTGNPIGSFSTSTGENGNSVGITNWAIIGDFFAGGEYMDNAVKVVCAAYGQFEDTDSLSQLLIDAYKNQDFVVNYNMGYWYTLHEGVYFMAAFSVEDDTAILCDFTLMEKENFKNYLELNNTHPWAQEFYAREFEK